MTIRGSFVVVCVAQEMIQPFPSSLRNLFVVAGVFLEDTCLAVPRLEHTDQRATNPEMNPLVQKYLNATWHVSMNKSLTINFAR